MDIRRIEIETEANWQVLTTLLPTGKAKGKGKKGGKKSVLVTTPSKSASGRTFKSITPTKLGSCAGAAADDSDDSAEPLASEADDGEDDDDDVASGVTQASAATRISGKAKPLGVKKDGNLTKDELLAEKWTAKLNFRSVMKGGKLGRTLNQALHQDINCVMFSSERFPQTSSAYRVLFRLLKLAVSKIWNA